MLFGKLNPELKSKWLTALRSGEYEQARGDLSRGKGFCCLGVLCQVAGLELEKQSYGVTHDASNAVVVDGVVVGYKPIEDLLGGGEVGSDAVSELYSRNDGLREHHKHSFAKIADYIEEKL